MRSATLLCLVVLTLVACTATPSPTPDLETDIPASKPSVGESPLSPPATPTPTPPEKTSPLPDPASSPIEPPSRTTEDVMAAAREHLAAELDIASDLVKVTAVEPMKWSDGSLGCPQPGEAYAQVITPGYRIILKVDGKAYELHADERGRTIVICERELERAPAAGVAYLADELGISVKEIEVLSVEMVEWPDASLGCPEPDKSYAQVITPGYRIILSAQGERYEVHTDEDGQVAILCESEL